MISRRLFLRESVMAWAMFEPPRIASSEAFTPERFGAKGDGITNDSQAFSRLAAAVNAAGGGIIALRRTTYIVGAQSRLVSPDRRYSFAPLPLLEIIGCPNPVEIRGNGAILRCPPGLRFGTFDASTGEPTTHALPFYGFEHRATPYEAMILLRDCTDSVLISDLELDGNLARLRIGGRWGDTGWQIPARGIMLMDNRGDEVVRNVRTHHHGQDGLMIGGRDDPSGKKPPTRIIENVESDFNGRQGCSLIGGRGYVFRGCRFSHTGRSAVASAPGAGVDIEAEGGRKVRALRFEDCRFDDNFGCGLVADTGDSEGVTFARCLFVGTTNWAAWPNKPRFHFRDCRFVGSVANCYGDSDPGRAAQFYDCTFIDDPRLAPGGKVYREGRANGSLANLGERANVGFIRCRFYATAGAVLPWSTHAVYQDCRMRQSSKVVAYPRGRYLGSSTIVGAVDLYGSNVVGSLTVNGKVVPRGAFGVPAS
jgi:hypothetical protein